MTTPDSSNRRIMVLGGGLAGTLAAAALAPHCDEVVIVERHVLPAGPQPRRGLPQSRHAHMLWSGGADAVEYLLPGTISRWLSAGGHRIPLPTGMVSLSPGGWFRRWRASHYLITASRDVIDWGIRAGLEGDAKVRFVRGEPTRLLGDCTRITGAVIRRPGDIVENLHADLVIDAMGRASRTTTWLEELGVPAVPESVIDAGVTYASRRYQAPPGTPESWPVVHIQADPRRRSPGRVASILPIEGGQWLVSLSGTRGGEPTSDSTAYEAYAAQARSPLVAEFLARAEPLGPVTVTRTTANRRRHFEKLGRRMPSGVIAIGDAATALNPVYGHGMATAAQGARALADLAARTGDISSPRFARLAQRAIGRPAAAAWILATGQDIFFPESRGKRPNLIDHLTSAYIRRLIHTATGDLTATDALTDVMSLQASVGALAHPAVLLAALRGPQLPALTGPPLTPAEERVLRAPQRSALYQG
ncbi:pyridine nucleotide-disulfide oxidoreductase [Streptomyces sp. NPDC059650]|uniref:pyridine nucleotide-disulfide oxidoreductase n=1 Tax=Streptomyces sp. NPDC059650 TaxID=3346896 RepID=UPI0036CD7317